MKVLIIRFSSIGDIVLTTPIVRAVKQQLNAEVHFATQKRFAMMVENNPYVDKIMTLDNDDSSFIVNLKLEKYDLILDLHKNLRTKRIRAALRTKYLTFDKINIKKWLIVNLKIDLLPNKHIVDRYFEAFNTIGIKNDHRGLDFFFSKNITSKTKEINLPKSPFIVIVLGATYFTKRIPDSLISDIIKGIKQPITLIGGKDVSELSEKIKKENKNNLIYDFCGKVDIETSAYIMKESTAIISADTGMMHIAAALQKPIISIWGNTIPKFGMYPYYGNNEIQSSTIEIVDLGCRPCSKIGYQKCPKGHFKCMKEINAIDVLTKLD